MTEDRAALVGRLRHLSVAIGAPIEARRTRKDEERWSAELADIAAALAMQPPVARDEMEEGVPDLREEVRVLRDCASVNLALYKGAMQDRAIAEQRAEAAMGLLAEWADHNCGRIDWPLTLVARTRALIAGGAAEVGRG